MDWQDPLESTGPVMKDGLWTPRRWLARLSVSFVILAAVLAWQGYQVLSRGAAVWRGGMDLVAASASLSLAVLGARERHRPRGD